MEGEISSRLEPFNSLSARKQMRDFSGNQKDITVPIVYARVFMFSVGLRTSFTPSVSSGSITVILN
jgi:hypothetical protein